MKGIQGSRPWPIGSHTRGFTLIELLVVIAIIALLAALLIPVAMGAMTAAKNARIAVEIGEIEKALQQFKVQYGAYPPDFSLTDGRDTQQIDQFMQRNFRNRNVAQDQPDKSGDDVADSLWSDFTLDPSEALFFWLGGESLEQQPWPNKKWHGGFSKDPFKPKAGKVRQAALFNFDKSRLRDINGNGFYEYYPEGLTQPYVYLASANYVERYNTFASSTDPAILPYVVRVPQNPSQPQQQDFVEASGFQLICAGLDNDYGTSATNALQIFPTGPYAEGHADNVTNFSEGTLESKLP